MTKTDYREYIQSSDWQERRKEFLLDHAECKRCSIPRWLAEVAYDNDLHVHHKSYANLGNEDWEDLEALCRRCHEIEKFRRSDLREPKNAICDDCDKIHWNPYSNLCQICASKENDLPEPCCTCGKLFIPSKTNFLICSFCDEISKHGCDRAFYSFDLKHPHHKDFTIGEYFTALACIHYDGIDNFLNIISKNEELVSLAIKIRDSNHQNNSLVEIEGLL